MSYFGSSGIGNAIATMLIGCIIGFVLLVGVGVYSIYKTFTDTVITVEHKVQPTYKLITDGQSIDTVWVYTFK